MAQSASKKTSKAVKASPSRQSMASSIFKVFEVFDTYSFKNTQPVRQTLPIDSINARPSIKAEAVQMTTARPVEVVYQPSKKAKELKKAQKAEEEKKEAQAICTELETSVQPSCNVHAPTPALPPPSQMPLSLPTTTPTCSPTPKTVPLPQVPATSARSRSQPPVSKIHPARLPEPRRQESQRDVKEIPLERFLDQHQPAHVPVSEPSPAPAKRGRFGAHYHSAKASFDSSKSSSAQPEQYSAKVSLDQALGRATARDQFMPQHRSAQASIDSSTRSSPTPSSPRSAISGVSPTDTHTSFMSADFDKVSHSGSSCYEEDELESHPSYQHDPRETMSMSNFQDRSAQVGAVEDLNDYSVIPEHPIVSLHEYGKEAGQAQPRSELHDLIRNIRKHYIANLDRQQLVAPPAHLHPAFRAVPAPAPAEGYLERPLPPLPSTSPHLAPPPLQTVQRKSFAPHTQADEHATPHARTNVQRTVSQRVPERSPHDSAPSPSRASVHGSTFGTSFMQAMRAESPPPSVPVRSRLRASQRHAAVVE